MPTIIDASSDKDDYFNRDPAISNDARNAINRSYAKMQNQFPYFPPGQPPYDIRVATYDSDSTHTHLPGRKRRREYIPQLARTHSILPATHSRP